LEIYIEISIFFILKDVITQTFCTFAGVIPMPLGKWVGRRHIRKRHWCFVFGYLKLPQYR